MAGAPPRCRVRGCQERLAFHTLSIRQRHGKQMFQTQCKGRPKNNFAVFPTLSQKALVSTLRKYLAFGGDEVRMSRSIGLTESVSPVGAKHALPRRKPWESGCDCARKPRRGETCSGCVMLGPVAARQHVSPRWGLPNRCRAVVPRLAPCDEHVAPLPGLATMHTLHGTFHPRPLTCVDTNAILTATQSRRRASSGLKTPKARSRRTSHFRWETP